MDEKLFAELVASVKEGGAILRGEVSGNRTDLLTIVIRLLKRRGIEAFCQRNHIRHLSLFGSLVSGGFGPESDIDMLAEFEPEHTPGLDFFSMEAELSQMLGRKVNLLTPNFLSPEIRQAVLVEAVTVYQQT